MAASRAPNTFVSGIVLAAGCSRRMGTPKQLLALRGRPLVCHVIDHAVASRLDEVIVVLGHHSDEVAEAIGTPASAKVRVVVNDDYRAGQSSSLRFGLRSAAASSDVAAILLGDQPDVTAELIDQMAEAFHAADPARTPVVRPVFDRDGERVPGHPVFIARAMWPEVERLRGDQGLRPLLAEHPERQLDVPIAGEPPADLDTPEDYRQRL